MHVYHVWSVRLYCGYSVMYVISLLNLFSLSANTQSPFVQFKVLFLPSEDSSSRDVLRWQTPWLALSLILLLSTTWPAWAAALLPLLVSLTTIQIGLINQVPSPSRGQPQLLARDQSGSATPSSRTSPFGGLMTPLPLCKKVSHSCIHKVSWEKKQPSSVVFT